VKCDKTNKISGLIKLIDGNYKSFSHNDLSKTLEI